MEMNSTIELKDFMARLNATVEQQLAELVNHPLSHGCIYMRPIGTDFPVRPILDLQVDLNGFSWFRETMIYEYILEVLRDELLPITKEILFECISAMRKARHVSVEDSYFYHQAARLYYEQLGLTNKALAHERAEIAYSVMEDVQYDSTFNFAECVRLIKNDPERLKSFVLYAVSRGYNELVIDTSLFARSNYVLLEESLKLGVKLFAEDEACDPLLRACIYDYLYRYYHTTNRPELAERARLKALELGGERDYEEVCEQLLEQLPPLYRIEEEMIDTIYDYIELYEQFDDLTFDEMGASNDDYEEQQAKWAEKLSSSPEAQGLAEATDEKLHDIFGAYYLRADKGDVKAMQEVARRYREGIGVSVCVAAADAWDAKAEKAVKASQRLVK